MSVWVDAFALDPSWPGGIEHGEDDVSEIVIRVNDQILTRVVDVAKDETRDFVRAPAVSLASWLADNWWRLRYEPYPGTIVPTYEWRQRHELTAGAGGIRWPPIMIYGAGDRVVLAPRSGRVDIPGPMRYVNLFVTSVLGETYERGLDRFFESVEEHASSAAGGAALCVLLQDLRRERADHDVVEWRRLEAQLGFDPDAVSPELMEQLAVLGRRLGTAAISEAAMSAPGIDSARALESVLSAAHESTAKINRDAARFHPLHQNGTDTTEPAWVMAEKSAAAVRVRVGMPHGPIRATQFADILGAKWTELRDAAAKAQKLPYGAIVGCAAGRERLALQSPQNWGTAYRRFELARALGDAAWEVQTNFAPISRAKTERQKFQRAFAQSFLCPFDDLVSYIQTETPSEADIANAARYFHVTEGVVRTVLVNKRVLPRERLEDWLEVA